MYDTRWPRPGPAMAAVAVVLGLVAGAVLGLSSQPSAPRAAASAPPETIAAPTTTTLPDNFWTVVLGSYNDRANANARLREVRNLGVKDAALLTREEFNLATGFAVFSGQFDSQEKAEAYQEELRGLGISNSFRKPVSRKA